jgi:ferredoxin
MIVQSDPALLTEVKKYGNFDTNACFQCGSCTVICNLTKDTASFPRRIFRYVLLGLRKPLLSSLEPWLCYYCGDCSTTCPRQTEPAESMMTLRRYLSVQYDWTGISSKIYKSKAWEIGILTIIGLLVLLMTLIYHITVGLPFSAIVIKPVLTNMEHMFSIVTVFTISIFAFAIFFLILNAARMFWYTVHKDNEIHIPPLLFLTEAKTFISHAITQKLFLECTDRSRWIKHLSLVSGCVIMFLILVFFLKWFQTDNLYPIYHPQRWLGYLATGSLMYATLEILIGRIRKREQIHMFSDPTDWTLPIMILLTAISGIAVHILRYSGLSLAAHFTYAVHVAITVPMIIIEIPFGKWTHAIYRPLAIYFQTIKEKALQQQITEETVLDHAG